MDLNKCSLECTSCIRSYKYKHSLQKGDKFQIVCGGIPLQYVSPELRNILPQEQIETTESLLDPVKWAATVLDWHCLDPDGKVWKRKNLDEYEKFIRQFPDAPILGRSRYHRPYQALSLRCSSLWKVLRWGRRLGKCLPSGTLVQMSDGTQRSIELIKDGDKVLSLDKDYQFKSEKAFLSNNGIKEVYKIELMDGRSIEATSNHPFFRRKKIRRQTKSEARAEGRKERRYGIYEDKWVELKDLTSGDMVAVPKNLRAIDQQKEKTISDNKIKILALLIGDGNITLGKCRFTTANQTILKELKKAVKEEFGTEIIRYECDKEIDYHLLGHGCGKRHPIKKWLEELGIDKLNSHQKYIPDIFMKMSNEDTALFLRYLYACDGWASVSKNNNYQIGYCTVSEKLASQIISLLARFNIYASCRKKKAKLNGKVFHCRQIEIHRKESIQNFRNLIGIFEKEEALDLVYRTALESERSNWTERYEENDITFIRIRSISLVGEKQTWDLTVPETHNFIANNILVHNTDALCIKILYNSFTKPGIADDLGYKTLVLTPYQSQVDLIYNRLLELLRNGNGTYSTIKHSIKSPHCIIELWNNSKIKLFTAGSKSGGNADAVRGQDANMVVFDEADYLTPGDIDSALAIIADHPDAMVWMSSTPKGTREKFFDVCRSPLYKEFHYPSEVSPVWSEQTEKYFRDNLSSIAYNHEIKAIFSEHEEGVFQKAFIDRARTNYFYQDQKPESNWVYTIGVDWNDVKNGTNIAVVGFNPTNSTFRLVGKEVVSREGWTQLAACEVIANLNRVWNPVAIYVDRGFGGTQYEILTKFGHDSLANPSKGPRHPDSRLRTIVKQYDFGSTIEIRDLFTQQPIKKAAKPFLVENTVRRFETGSIQFSDQDELLTKQLSGYIIDRVTTAGVPVYKASDEKAGDHLLDALMLALVGFTLEKTPFGVPVVRADFAFSDKFGSGNQVEEKEGRIIISNPYRDKENKNPNKPEMNRAEEITTPGRINLFTSGLPASHVNHQERLWANPEFSNEVPLTRTSNEFKRITRPKRSMF